MRSFIAVDVPEELRPVLVRAAIALRERIGKTVRVSPAENLHLTLKFLGELAPEQEPDLIASLHKLAQTTPGFELHVDGYGAFPDAARARVFWAGVTDPQGGRLQGLVRDIESVSCAAGFDGEKRHFTPHITVARLRRPTPLPLNYLAEIDDTSSLYRFEVNKIILFESRPTQGGPVYSPVESFSLQ